VSIKLNITAPITEVEVHALGLTIGDVELAVYQNGKLELLNGGKYRLNEERESIVVPSLRLILPRENVTLTISYSGTARMDGQGFFESWNAKENATDVGYISLNTDCEPTSARRWFPCFDEPDKKATFQLSIAHPGDTTAYSNTRLIHSSVE
ncbi:hypothetical protein PMAYCL1PPCAC_32277, partial [Pristionchus mayeri]